MLCLDNFKALIDKLGPDSSNLEAVQADRDEAVDFPDDGYEFLPYFLVLPELLEEVSYKESHLLLDLVLHVLHISH